MPVGITEHEMDLSYSPAGNLPSPIWLLGTQRVQALGLTGSDSSVYDCSGHPMRLRVNSVTGSGVVELTGMALELNCSKPLPGFAEQLVVDGPGDYLTDHAWWSVTNVAVQGGITAIDYDLLCQAHLEYPGRTIEPQSYHLDVTPKGGINRHIQFYLVLSQVDAATKRITDTVIEDLTLQRAGATTQIIDAVRSGAEDRSTLAPVLELVGEVYAVRALDLDDYGPVRDPALREVLWGKVDWNNIDYFHLLLKMISNPRI